MQDSFGPAVAKVASDDEFYNQFDEREQQLAEPRKRA